MTTHGYLDFALQVRHLVLNKRTAGVPDGAVYVGRPAEWGNPFRMGAHLTRLEAVQMYSTSLLLESADHLFARIGSLRSLRLVCWCSPQLCHAHVLALALAADPADLRARQRDVARQLYLPPSPPLVLSDAVAADLDGTL